jgi:hypothetical protein
MYEIKIKEAEDIYHKANPFIVSHHTWDISDFNDKEYNTIEIRGRFPTIALAEAYIKDNGYGKKIGDKWLQPDKAYNKKYHMSIRIDNLSGL